MESDLLGSETPSRTPRERHVVPVYSEVDITQPTFGHEFPWVLINRFVYRLEISGHYDWCLQYF
jgi:hypothetical protein